MTVLLDLVQFILDAQGVATPYTCADPTATVIQFIPPSDPPPNFECANCGGSAFSPIAAAFGTIGYWAQAGWLDQIYNHGMHKFALVAYLIAAIGGIIGFVMGGNPRPYIWLFVGPAVFYWLTENRTGVQGVAWEVGKVQQDQREVWRMSESGLINEHFVQKYGFGVSADAAPRLGALTPCESEDGACVSDFFAYFDLVVSDSVQWLIRFLGAGKKVFSDNTNPDSTNIIRGTGSIGTADLINTSRWEFFANITEARINNPDLRRSFESFMSSECGDQLLESVRFDVLNAVKERKTSPLYTAVLKSLENPAPFAQRRVSEVLLFSNLNGIVPTPRDLRKIINENDYGFLNSNPLPSMSRQSNIKYLADNYKRIGSVRTVDNEEISLGEDVDYVISCKRFLVLLMQGLRWEAAHIAYQIMSSGPDGILPIDYAASMLYGMRIKYPDDDIAIQGPPGFSAPGPLFPLPGVGQVSMQQLRKEHIPQFIEAMVLAKIFSNELQITPAAATTVHNQYNTITQKSVENIADFQRVNNQKAKFGELYAWAEMLPYFQGNLLYYLAILYPFACMFVVVPGHFKGFIQWCQFWVWVKLWDLGFALVTVLEGSVWAITSSAKSSDDFNSLMLQIAAVNGTNGTSLCAVANYPDGSGLHPDVTTPAVAVDPYFNAVFTGSGSNDNSIFYMQWMLDRLIAASADTGIDMANTYYIFIMSSLYLAVPGVIGTLVLGAKAGMASMISSTIGGIASPAGSAAGTAGTQDFQKGYASNSATFNQEAYAKSLRSGAAAGFAKKGLDAGNQAAGEQLAGALVGAQSQQMSTWGSLVGQDVNAHYSLASRASAASGAAFGVLNGIQSGFANLKGATDKKAGEALKTPAGASIPNPNRLAAEAAEATNKASPGGGGGLTGGGLTGGASPEQMAMSQALATAQNLWDSALKSKGGRFLSGFAGGSTGLLQSQLPGAISARGAHMFDSMSRAKNAEVVQNMLAMGNKNLESTGHSTAGTVYGLAGQRQEQLADFEAQEARFAAADNANHAMAGTLAAVTGQGGAGSPGQRHMGGTAMAMAGRFEGGQLTAQGFDPAAGHGSRRAAFAAHDGGALSQFRSQGMADLRANYGDGYLSSAYSDVLSPNAKARADAGNNYVYEVAPGVAHAYEGLVGGFGFLPEYNAKDTDSGIDAGQGIRDGMAGAKLKDSQDSLKRMFGE